MKSADKQAKKDELYRKKCDFKVKQAQSYSFKKNYAYIRAWEFYNHPDIAGNCYVAVGGLDSITLLLFLRSIGINVPAVSVSALEDKSIQAVHKQLGVQTLKPLKSKVEVIREFGWPVLSKDTAKKINALQNPTAGNAVYRHAIITGIKGDGEFSKYMQLPKKWLEKFGGYENENEGTNFEEADFKVSDACCWYMKELPLNIYARETGCYPYEGLMASEGGRRARMLPERGCNYISPGTKRSCPFAIFSRQDLLELALELNVPVPEIYGEIVRGQNGMLRTTKAQRTGCSMCGFGVHLEKRPHRFDQLWARNPGEWEMWMSRVDKLQDGTWYGWGHVLDYIGVEWREPWAQFETQMRMEGL